MLVGTRCTHILDYKHSRCSIMGVDNRDHTLSGLSHFQVAAEI